MGHRVYLIRAAAPMVFGTREFLCAMLWQCTRRNIVTALPSSLDIPTRGPGRPGSGLRLAGAIYVLTYIYMAYLHVLRVKSTGRSGGTSPVGLTWRL